MVSRDVYGRHPAELTESQIEYCKDFMALSLVEMEEVSPKNGSS